MPAMPHISARPWRRNRDRAATTRVSANSASKAARPAAASAAANTLSSATRRIAAASAGASSTGDEEPVSSRGAMSSRRAAARGGDDRLARGPGLDDRRCRAAPRATTRRACRTPPRGMPCPRASRENAPGSQYPRQRPGASDRPRARPRRRATDKARRRAPPRRAARRSPCCGWSRPSASASGASSGVARLARGSGAACVASAKLGR